MDNPGKVALGLIVVVGLYWLLKAMDNRS